MKLQTNKRLIAADKPLTEDGEPHLSELPNEERQQQLEQPEPQEAYLSNHQHQ